MSANVLSPKELKHTCNAALAVIDDLTNRLPDLDEEQEENAEDASERLQSIVNAAEIEQQQPPTTAVSNDDLLQMLQTSQCADDTAESLQSALDSIRDTLRFILHDAGVRVDPDIAFNDGN